MLFLKVLDDDANLFKITPASLFIGHLD